MGRDEPAEIDEYSDLIDRLYVLEPPSLTGGSFAPVPMALRFGEGAQALRDRLEAKHLELTALESVNKKLAAHIGKYNGLFARLCVIWHCVENADPDLSRLVTEYTAGRVADFMDRFLLPHALSFYAGVLGLADGHDRLAAVAGHILAHKLEKITNRDVQRGDRSMRELERRDIESVFDQLDALGWINRVPGPRSDSLQHPETNRRVAIGSLE